MPVDSDLYPSRTGDAEQIISRADPIIHGNGAEVGPYSLDAGQLSFFETNGFIVLERYLEDIVTPLLSELDRICEYKESPELFTEPESEAVRSIFDVPRFSHIALELARHPKMLDIAEQILGSPVYLHQSRFNIKPAHEGRSFSWHSDFETWHTEDGLPRCRCVTGWIMLTENTPYNGPLFIIPGSHRHYVSCGGITPEDHYRASLRKQILGSPSRTTIRRLAEHSRITGVYGPPGTVVFHEGNIMHGSPDNISPWPRSNLFFVYNSVENPPSKPFGATRRRPAFLANPDTTPLR